MSALPCTAAAAFVLLALSGFAPAADLALDVTLDPVSRRFDAVAEMIAPGELAFTLHDSLSVRRATVDGRPAKIAAVPFHRNSNAWRIPAPAGAKLRIEYAGTLPELDRALDHRKVLGGVAPMASAAGSFLPAGSGWYPRPRGAFSYTVHLSLPAGQRGLVPGALVEETVPRAGDSRYRARYGFAQAAEGIDLMAGPYVVREKTVRRDGAEPLRLRTYFYRELETLADAYLEDSARYIALYSREIGAYPFASFSIVASPLPTGFGMPTLTYIGAQVLKLPFIRATSLGHEVLHNWWGNGVHVDHAKGNWSEGLTTFMADYHYREQESAAAAKDTRLAWLRDFAAIPEGAHQPLSAFRSRTHGAEAAVGYGKSAMLFFMLRDVIGEDAFRRSIQRFWLKHRFTAASWDDLEAAFAEVSGKQLGSFFRQWLQRSGGPEIVVAEARAKERDRKTTLSLTLEQKSPPYTLDVPVEMVSKDKTEVRYVRIDRERTTTELEVDALPDGIRLDPDFRLWRRLSANELPPILREWIISRAPGVVIASTDTAVRSAAESVAQSFFESRSREIPAAQMKNLAGPVLLIGLHGAVDDTLAALRLPPRPASLSGSGSAQVWTIDNREAGVRLAVVSARDEASLRALSRPLPHYGSQSYLSFEGAKLLTRGVWPAQAPVVRVVREP